MRKEREREIERGTDRKKKNAKEVVEREIRRKN